MLRNLALSMAVFFIFLITGILSLEVYFYHRDHSALQWHDPNTRFDPYLGWSPIPHRSILHDKWGKITSNALGFRSGEVDPAKKHVILLGDSVTWGNGVSDTETAAYHLENLLKSSGTQVDNLGVSGYGLDQYWMYLDQNIRRIPNLETVVLMICTDNDLENTGSNVAYGKRKPLFRYRDGELIAPQGLIRKFCFRNIVAKSLLLQKAALESPFLKTWFARLAGDITLEDEERDAVALALIEKISRLAAENHAGFLMVLSPSMFDFEKKSDGLVWFEKLCETGHYPCLNLLPVIQDAVTETMPLGSYYFTKSHYTDLGNRLVAEAIEQNLNSNRTPAGGRI